MNGRISTATGRRPVKTTCASGKKIAACAHGRVAGLHRFLVLALSIAATTILVFGVQARGQDAENVNRVWLQDYRHLHKPQAVAANADRYADMVAACNAMLAEYPRDAESLFFLALAQSQEGRVAVALETMGRAEQAELPLQRLLTAPDSWNRVLRQDAAYEPFRQRHQLRVAQGPMLGCLGPSTVSVWVRTPQATNVTVRVSDRADLSHIVASAEAVTENRDDNSIAIRVEGLRPATRYFYDVVTPDGSHFEPRYPSFRTAPALGQATRLTFAFGGGAAYTPRMEHMWQTIAGRHPDLLLLLGDNVYIDDPLDTNYQRYLYHRRQSVPAFRDLVARSAVYSIWDDHDFGTNDCEGGPAEDDPKWKPHVWEVFRQNWVNPAYGGGRSRPGCWYDLQYGDIQFFFLDGRYYRTQAPNAANGQPTMLGPDQKRWLLEELVQSTARLKFLVSPVPWIGGNRDKWNGFAAERAEIFAHLSKHRIGGVVLLSADRHRSDLLVTRRDADYDLYEFMSSKLTNHHTHAEIDTTDGALFSYNDKCSFGLVTVDSRADDPQVTYEIYSIDGERMFSFQLNASQLSSSAP